MGEEAFDRPLTGDQHHVLGVIFEFFREHRQWPNYRWLNQFVFVQDKLELDPVFNAMPPGYVLPDPSVQPAGSRDTTVSLTLRAIVTLAADRELDLLLKTLRYFGERAASFMPPPEGPQDLSVTSTEVAESLGCSSDDPALLLIRDIVTNSIWEIWGGAGTSPDGVWTVTLIPEKARVYRDLASIDDLLRAREPLDRQRLTWSRNLGGFPKGTEQTPMAEPAAAPDADDSDRDRTVFVVYGRNDSARQAMFDFLAAAGLEPLDWEKLLAATGEGSPYIGDVLEAGFPMAQAVVVLLTPDDEARIRPAFRHPRDPRYETELTPQARPNVLFEAGMAFISHPKRTILVELGELRPFSDVAGRHTVRMNDSIEARRSVINRLRTAGCQLSLGGDEWKTAGNFAGALSLAVDGDDDARDASGAGNSDIARFVLVPAVVSTELGGGPITLEVQNNGPTEEFEATVTKVSGSAGARPPWYVRWRNSQDKTQEIMTGHSWILEVCEDDATAGYETGEWTPGWRFLSPTGDRLVVPDQLGSALLRYGSVMRATVRVTPRSDPTAARENTVTISLNERGRVAGWDAYRVE